MILRYLRLIVLFPVFLTSTLSAQDSDLGRAEQNLERGEWDDVKAFLNKKPAFAGKESFRLALMQARYFYIRGQIRESREKFQQALKIASDQDIPPLDLLVEFGRLQLASGRLKEAGDLFQRALDLDPQHPSALIGRIHLFDRLGKFGESRTILKSLINGILKNKTSSRTHNNCLVLELYLIEG